MQNRGRDINICTTLHHKVNLVAFGMVKGPVDSAPSLVEASYDDESSSSSSQLSSARENVNCDEKSKVGKYSTIDANVEDSSYGDRILSPDLCEDRDSANFTESAEKVNVITKTSGKRELKTAGTVKTAEQTSKVSSLHDLQDCFITENRNLEHSSSRQRKRRRRGRQAEFSDEGGARNDLPSELLRDVMQSGASHISFVDADARTSANMTVSDADRSATRGGAALRALAKEQPLSRAHKRTHHITSLAANALANVAAENARKGGAT